MCKLNDNRLHINSSFFLSSKTQPSPLIRDDPILNFSSPSFSLPLWPSKTRENLQISRLNRLFCLPLIRYREPCQLKIRSEWPDCAVSNARKALWRENWARSSLSFSFYSVIGELQLRWCKSKWSQSCGLIWSRKRKAPNESTWERIRGFQTQLIWHRTCRYVHPSMQQLLEERSAVSSSFSTAKGFHRVRCKWFVLFVLAMPRTAHKKSPSDL